MNWVNENREWIQRARERWAPRQCEPLLIRAWLASPVANDCFDPLQLEGALQSAVVLRETGRAPDDVFDGCPLDAPLEDTDIQIPVADDKQHGIPIAMVSCGWFSPDATPDVRWRRRRVRAEQYGKDIVNTASGNTKAEQRPVPVVSALHVDFYAIGDREMIVDLLLDASTLGASRAGGLGQVKGFEVDPGAEVWWERGPGGRLMRAMPAPPAVRKVPDYAVGSYDTREATVRAPYWHPRTRMMCCVPVQRLGETLG